MGFQIDQAEIDRRFDFHPADTVERQNAHQTMRDLHKHVAERCVELLPEGREKSLCITALEEALFWANAAIARDDA